MFFQAKLQMPHNLLNNMVKLVTAKCYSLVTMSVLVYFSVTMIKHRPKPACWRKGVCQLAGYSLPLEKIEARSQGRHWSRAHKKCWVLFKCVIVLLSLLYMPLLTLVLLLGWYFLLFSFFGCFHFFNFRISVSFFFWYFNFLPNFSSFSFDLYPQVTDCIVLFGKFLIFVLNWSSYFVHLLIWLL